MTRRTFIPNGDAELLAWATNFSTLISVEPTSYGLTAAQATAFASLTSAYSSAYTMIKTPANRTSPAIVAKNNARKALVAGARELAAIVQATPTVTDEQKADLGLTVRKTHHTPVPAPSVRPGMLVVSAIARTVTVRIFDSASTNHRGKPANIIGAKVYTYIGSDYPSDPALWDYNGDATKFQYEIAFDDTVPSGSQVWICAAWYNRKGETGPASVPISTNIQGGGSFEQQAAGTSDVKLAA